MTRWGPQRLAGDRWRFNLWAPDCADVMLELEDGRSLAMEPSGEGWKLGEAQAPVGTGYRFRVDPFLAVPDPASRAQRGGPHGWSILCDPQSYDWSSTAWRGRPWHEAVIQEVHVGAPADFVPFVRGLGPVAAAVREL